jgi:ubiquinone/menaquinone biosynthesis C-methylase UbiE
MAGRVDLYNSAYGNYELDAYRQVRIETYGEDLGQTSWVTTEESNEIPTLLELGPGSQVLEIGSGSGRYALRIAEITGCHIVGLDINANGIRNANELARRTNLDSLVHFEHCDVSEKLPFGNETFDAAFANDVLCHIPNRPSVLSELARVLKPGGRLLFSDALVIGGLITHEEIATRSSIGYYIFSPPGVNEELIQAAGLQIARATDATGEAASIAKRWHDARAARQAVLIAAEGLANFEGLQRFLSCVHTLTGEKRLLRKIYLARKRASKAG